MNGIVFVTSNENKHREVQEVLGISIERIALDLSEIQSMDLREVITEKLQQAYRELRRPVIVEDTSLGIDAWNGFPGPFIKHMATTWRNKNLW